MSGQDGNLASAIRVAGLPPLSLAEQVRVQVEEAQVLCAVDREDVSGGEPARDL